MARKLKKADYTSLVWLIFKFSEFDIDKATILLKYIICKMYHKGIDPVFNDKLQVDTHILLQDWDYTDIAEYKATAKELNKTFNHFVIIEFKSKVFDALENSYNN